MEVGGKKRRGRPGGRARGGHARGGEVGIIRYVGGKIRCEGAGGAGEVRPRMGGGSGAKEEGRRKSAERGGGGAGGRAKGRPRKRGGSGGGDVGMRKEPACGGGGVWGR